MKTCYLDANVLYFFQDSQSLFHQKAEDMMRQLVEGGYILAISSLCLDEYLHTVLRFSGKSRQEMAGSLKSSLRKMFKLPGLILINPPQEKNKHIKVVGLIAKHDLRPRDAYHLFIMIHHKIRYFATFDTDFERVFESTKLRNPQVQSTHPGGVSA